MNSLDERQLREAFRRFKRREEETFPSFDAVLARSSPPVKKPAQSIAWLAASCAAALLLAALFEVRSPDVKSVHKAAQGVSHAAVAPAETLSKERTTQVDFDLLRRSVEEHFNETPLPSVYMSSGPTDLLLTTNFEEALSQD